MGGPGNGKSEAVEAFLGFLDVEVNAGGQLIALAKRRFTEGVGVPRKVVLLADELPADAAQRLRRATDRLIIVQDASAMDTQGDASQALVDDLAGLSQSSEDGRDIYLCCVNRGVLAGACRLAFRAGSGSRPFATLRAIIEATAFRLGSAVDTRPTCWPLQDPRVACWPLDVSSLFERLADGVIPGGLLLAEAVTPDKWEAPGRCSDCDSRQLCPFRENAKTYREPSNLAAVVQLIRRGELASGERLNFRSTLSLVAELIVGDWPDFAGLRDPCEWVHEEVEHASGSSLRDGRSIRATLRLVSRLLPHAMFREQGSQALLREIQRIAIDGGHRATAELVAEASRAYSIGNSSLRRSTVPQVLDPLDPAWYSPEDLTSELRRIEDSFSQSVADGNAAFGSSVSSIEKQLLQAIQDAEAEWESPAASDARESRQVQRWLRGWSSRIVKRSVGTRTCHHTHEEYLTEFEGGLRERAQLLSYIEGPLRLIIGRSTFQFGVMESFGRAMALEPSSLVLHASSPGITLRPAPSASATSPGHDFPILFVDDHGIALTFEVFLALRLQGSGCTSSSLPPGVRAALDQVRHLRAGRACRDAADFQNGRAWVTLGEDGRVTLDPSQGIPVFSPGRG